MDGNLLKRTLTMKSKIGFGYYAHMTVQQMFITEIEFRLIEMYYNLEKIDFTDNILEKLYITERIAKPGKDPDKRKEAYKRFFDKKKERMGDEKYMRSANTRKKKSKKNSNARAASIQKDKNFSKGGLQYKNQGRKKM